MLQIEQQAREASGLPVDKVHAAWDLSGFRIHHPAQREETTETREKKQKKGVRRK
jgi:hypothetical protein